MVGRRWSLLVVELLAWSATLCFRSCLPSVDLLDSPALQPSLNTLKSTKSLLLNACL